MFKDLGRSLLGRLVSLGIFALGFLVLYWSLDKNPLLLVLGVAAGSALILGGLYLMATTRRLAARAAAQRDNGPEVTDSPNEPGATEQEERAGDSLDGSGKSD